MIAPHRLRVAAFVALATLLVPAPAYAHAGHCTRPETISTFVVAVLVAAVLVRPWGRSMKSASRTFNRLVIPLVLAAAVTVTACGGKGRTSGARPTTTARLAILQPTANQVTGPDLTLQFRLIGAHVVQPSVGKLRGDEGHIHVSLDNKLISMTYGTTQDLHGLAPGPHTLQAEFVATDHQPFRNHVVAAVLFTVRS